MLVTSKVLLLCNHFLIMNFKKLLLGSVLVPFSLFGAEANAYNIEDLKDLSEPTQTEPSSVAGIRNGTILGYQVMVVEGEKTDYMQVGNGLHHVAANCYGTADWSGYGELPHQTVHAIVTQWCNW